MLVLLVGCENGNVISDNGNQNSEEIAETITALEVFCLWNVVKSRAVAVANSKIPTTSQE